jgi:LPS export ABC transporter permease LptF/LPS export ABC transporter permease LptG
MFKTIDRYILREIILPFVLGLVVLTFVLEIPVILRQGEDLVAKGVEWSIIARVLLTLLPSQLSLTIPMSVLLGILIGFGRLSSDREFVALQACGVSLVRLLRPLVFISVLATLFAAYETIVALPAANQTFREITYGVVASRVERSVRPGVFFEDFPNRVIYVRNLPTTGGWEDVFLADNTQPGRTIVYFARQGHIRLDREHRLVQLELIDGASHTTYADKPEKYDEEVFETFVISLDPRTVFPPPPAKGAPEMTFAELRERIAEAAKHGDPGYQYRMMSQQKLALPVTCPILALIGLGLGASNRKDGKLASFVLGFGVIFVYYIFLYVFRALAMGGRFSPEWAPWVPNIIMAATGVLMLVWRSRSADQPIRLSIPAFWRRDVVKETPAHDAAPTGAQSRRVLVVIQLPHLNIPTPRLLDVYLARQYWRIVFLSLVSLLGIFYISTFIDLADELFRKETTLGTVLRYFYFQTPQFVFYVIPMSVLVATLVTVALMTKNSELIVMRACGISLYRTAGPLVLFAALVAGALFLMQERLLPIANREADRLNRLVRGYGPQTSPFNQRWTVSRTGSLYHYDLFDANKNRFRHLWTYEVAQNNWRLGAMTYAGEVTLASPSAEHTTQFSLWHARDGWTRQFLQGKGSKSHGIGVTYKTYQERTQTLESPEYFGSRWVDTAQMTYDQMLTFNQLRDYIAQLRASGANVIPYTVALHRKIAFPLVTVIMTLLAVPFAAGGGRRGALYGIGVGILLALGYFVTMSVFGALGSGGVLTPTLAAWAPNLLFFAAALYMILTVRT